ESHGISNLHGPHHDAHAFTTSGRPLRVATRALYAVSPPPSSSLAWRCSAASAAGEPASSARACAGVGGFACGSVEPQPAASASRSASSVRAPPAANVARMARSLADHTIPPSYLLQCGYPPVLDGEALVRVVPVPGKCRTSLSRPACARRLPH